MGWRKLCSTGVFYNMKIGILVFGLVLFAIGYILSKLGGDASEHPEGVTYLGVTIDSGTMFSLSIYGGILFFLGILVTIAGAVLMLATREKKEED